MINRKILCKSGRRLTVSSLDEDSEQQQCIEHGPEDLATVSLDEADKPLVVEFRAGLGLGLLQWSQVVEWSER